MSPLSRRLGAAAVVFLGLGAGLLGAFRQLNPFDEAVILVGAERILHGELPFRDFFTPYPPGQYFAVAALFSLFGTKVMTLRLYCVAVRAVIALLLYLLARRLGGTALAASCAVASVLWLSACGYYGYPTFPTLALALLALWLLSNALDRPAGAAGARLAGAGAAIGAAALFRHDLGFYALAACLPLLVRLAALRAPGPGRRGAQDLADRARTLWPFAAGLVAAFALPAAWLLSLVPVEEVVFSLWTYPATTYARVRGLPYPPLFPGPVGGEAEGQSLSFAAHLDGLPFYVPPALFAGALLWLLLRRGGGRPSADPDDARLAAVALLGALNFNLARVRPDVIHAVAGILPAFVVAAALIRRARAAATPAARGAALAVAVASLLLLAWPLRTFPRGSLARVGALLAGRDSQARAERRLGGADRLELAAYLQSVVPPGGRIFVGCGRHDKVFANETVIYFLARRLPGARHHELDPGVATTPRVQREIARDLDRRRVKYVVISTRFDDKREPNESAVAGGVTDLDDYLRRNYAPERSFGAWLSVWRRTTPWEAAAAAL